MATKRAKAAQTREFDVVVFGATGFTGRLIVEYLAREYAEGGQLRLAMAGRNLAKLEQVRQEIAESVPGAAALPLITADSGDDASLRAMCARTAVVCTTVGPYAKYGAPLVAAAVAERTHYCDLTGEVHFIRASMDAHHAAAHEQGTRIVHACGFDSIPSDLGVWMMHRAFQERGGQLHRVSTYAGESRGGFSGGTVASMLNVIDELKGNRELRRMLANPYALYPAREPAGEDDNESNRPEFDDLIGMWTTPFLMAAINTRVVRRSNALLGFPYGRDFRYVERMSTGKGWRGQARAYGIAAALGAFLGASSVEILRAILQKTVLPAPGEGPNAEARENGFFVFRLIAQGEVNGQPVTLRGRIEGEQDPGYGETSKMLGEAAVSLALDGPQLHPEGGVRTPASTFGDRLLERLRAKSMVFRVESDR